MATYIKPVQDAACEGPETFRTATSSSAPGLLVKRPGAQAASSLLLGFLGQFVLVFEQRGVYQGVLLKGLSDSVDNSPRTVNVVT